MISVRQNPNFTKFFQIFAFGRFIDEVQGQAKALRIAKDEARFQQISKVNFLGNVLDIKNEN